MLDAYDAQFFFLLVLSCVPLEHVIQSSAVRPRGLRLAARPMLTQGARAHRSRPPCRG
jgi:hypothetical protein